MDLGEIDKYGYFIPRQVGCNKCKYDGLPIRSKTALDLRTENQWRDAGRRIKPGEKGYEMHPASLAKRTCIYYLPEQTY